MGMIINGNYLPDLPADVLANYPYALIFPRINTEESSEYGEPGTVREYRLLLSTQEILFVPVEIADTVGAEGFELLASFGAGIEYKYVPGDADWVLFLEEKTPFYHLWGRRLSRWNY